MRSPICAAALTVAMILSLGACGSGVPSIYDIIEGGDNGRENDQTPSTEEQPTPSSDEVKATIHRIYDRSDTLIVEYEGRPRWTGPREVFETSNLDDVVAALLDGRRWGAPPGYDFLENQGTFEFGGTEDGIAVAAALWDTTDHVRSTVSAHMSFGVWMTHSFILAKQALTLSRARDAISVSFDIFSIGASSGTNPTAAGGSATWNGVMLGFDEGFAGPDISRAGSGELNVYEGEAEITLTSFTNPAVDVRFSNITNEIHYLGDVIWRDLPVTAGGFEGRGILGRFYGPAHEEVGGVFQFGEINGAFGGTRD